MKRTIAVLSFVVVFAVGAYSGTWYMINKTNSNNNLNLVSSNPTKASNFTLNDASSLSTQDSISKVSNSINMNEKNVDSNSQKTLELNGTYFQNSCNVKNVVVHYDKQNIDIEIPQISGLKKKDIENKVNENIKEKLFSKIEENNINLTKDYFANNYSVSSNFANVLSIHYKTISNLNLNYELVNGTEIKFEDVISKDFDLENYFRVKLYQESDKNTIEMNTGDRSENGVLVEGPYYNAEKNKWYAKYQTWDEDEKIVVEKEYIIYQTEYDIEKELKKIMNISKEYFYFSPTSITYGTTNEYTISFKEIPDGTLIYDKYLTSESIFEKENKNIVSLFKCSNESIATVNYKESKFVSNNLVYDITSYSNDTEALNEVYEKIAEYKKIADSNPNEMYFIMYEIRENNFYNYQKEKNYNISWQDIGEKVIKCDIKEKDNLLNEILKMYRHGNRSYDGGTLFELIYENTDAFAAFDGTLNYPVVEKHFYNLFDKFNNKKIDSLSGIFKDGIDYKSQIYEYLLNKYEYVKNNLSYEEFSNLFEEKCRLTYEGLKIMAADENSNYLYVTIEKVPEIFNLVELDDYILNTHNYYEGTGDLNIAEYEIENFDNEKITLALNEIYAKHGQDFETGWIKEYFEKQNWYHPVKGKNVSYDDLSLIEQNNIDIIRSKIK